MIQRLILGMAAMMAAMTMTVAVSSAEQMADPYNSEAWQDILDLEFEGARVVYDESIYLVVPDQVETAFSVPVVMNFVHTPYEVTEVALFADNNPFPTVARIYPERPFKAIGFDIRLERSTPVRAAVKDADGTWHVIHKIVTVMTPGGCSGPSGMEGSAALGDIALRQFVRHDGGSRLRMRIGHPMHTGLVENRSGETIPAQFIERLEVKDNHGGLATMLLWASVAANPVFMFELPETQQSVRVTAKDNDGAAFLFDGAPSDM